MKSSMISEAHKKGDDLIVTNRKELSKRQSDKDKTWKKFQATCK